MGKEPRVISLAVIVGESERDVVRALAFLDSKSISEIIYGWIKPHLDQAMSRPEVQTVIEAKAEVLAKEV